MPHLFVDLWHGAFPRPEPYTPPARYVGLVKRIPADELPRIANGSESFVRINLEWDESPGSFERRLAQGQWVLAPGGATEQIEAIDLETGDLLVLWRAPCAKESK
jgi:hypothetical protein